MTKAYFISAYATSPSSECWNAAMEYQYFQALANNLRVQGIEHPFSLQAKHYNLDWLAQAIPAHWSIIITSLPLFMTMAKENPCLGLAAKQRESRDLALTIVEKMNAYVRQLNRLFARKVVKAVHLYSAPRNDDAAIRGDKEQLRSSLLAINEMDWDGAQLNLEHCDAYTPKQRPEKGFLSLEEEMDVVNSVGGYGITLNWGRSAIEARSSEGPLEHIQFAKKQGLLNGFFFSGCTAAQDSDYGAWKDSHVPPNRFIERPYLVPESLLGENEIASVLALLEDEHYLGIKVANPTKQKTLEKAIGLNASTIDAIDQLYKTSRLGLGPTKSLPCD